MKIETEYKFMIDIQIDENSDSFVYRIYLDNAFIKLLIPCIEFKKYGTSKRTLEIQEAKRKLIQFIKGEI